MFTSDFIPVILAIAVGFIIFFAVAIVPVVLKSMREAKEEKEYQEFKKNRNK